uniref:Chloride channel CLIC-like protein 1 n=1 Tax=Gongylonema pulchrum TaxID=637853 RepID=A0A183EGP3_9BILA
LLVQIDADLVMRCVRNLHFYGCLTLIPLFMYANTYVATEQLHQFYLNTDLIKECLDFVRPLDENGKNLDTKPTFSDVFRLYTSLKECLDFVRPLDENGENLGTKPTFSDVFRLYTSLKVSSFTSI